MATMVTEHLRGREKNMPDNQIYIYIQRGAQQHSSLWGWSFDWARSLNFQPHTVQIVRLAHGGDIVKLAPSIRVRHGGCCFCYCALLERMSWMVCVCALGNVSHHHAAHAFYVARRWVGGLWVALARVCGWQNERWNEMEVVWVPREWHCALLGVLLCTDARNLCVLFPVYALLLYRFMQCVSHINFRTRWIRPVDGGRGVIFWQIGWCMVGCREYARLEWIVLIVRAMWRVVGSRSKWVWIHLSGLVWWIGVPVICTYNTRIKHEEFREEIVFYVRFIAWITITCLCLRCDWLSNVLIKNEFCLVVGSKRRSHGKIVVYCVLLWEKITFGSFGLILFKC